VKFVLYVDSRNLCCPLSDLMFLGPFYCQAPGRSGVVSVVDSCQCFLGRTLVIDLQ
jgi:hypothetical protein